VGSGTKTKDAEGFQDSGDAEKDKTKQAV